MNFLFHIGFHKTASTWLQEGLWAEHPDLCLLNGFRTPWEDPVIRELVQPSGGRNEIQVIRRLLRARVREAHMRKPFRVGVVSAERLSGHPFSGGYDGQSIARRISLAFPKAKVVIGIRDQRKLIPSIYSELVKEGYPGTYGDLCATSSWKGSGFRFEMFMFDRLVSVYHDLLGRENVLVLPHEMLANNPEAYLESICRFAGIQFFKPSNLGFVSNPRPSGARRRALRFMNRFRRTELNRFPLIRIGDALRMRIVSIMSRLMVQPEREPEIPSAIIPAFSSSNRRLARLTGLKLDGYPGLEKTAEGRQ